MSEEVVVLRIFNNEIDARMAQQMLQSAGMRAFVFKDDAGGMEPHLQRTNGVRLVVSRVDAERAQEIIQDPAREENELKEVRLESPIKRIGLWPIPVCNGRYLDVDAILACSVAEV